MPKSASNIEIKRTIHVLRDHRAMLDEDLAKLCGVETKQLNEAVKRNWTRFPHDFAFRLTMSETDNLKTQSATSSSHGGRRRSVPMAFTEQGVAMLSSVLSSPRAIAVNVEIMRAFVKLRQAIVVNAELAKRLAVVEAKLDQHRAEFGKTTTDTNKTLAEHEKHIRIVFETIRRLMAEDEPTPPARVGFNFDSQQGFMAHADMRSEKAFYQELRVFLCQKSLPEWQELADLIQRESQSWTQWNDLPFFCKFLCRQKLRDSKCVLVLLRALKLGRKESPWNDLFNKGKPANAVRGNIFEAFVRQSLHLALGEKCKTPQIGKKSFEVQIEVLGTCVAIEASVLGQSMTDEAARAALFMQDQRVKTRVKDGYEAILRMTEKFLDKVADKCNPTACQLATDSPNLLFISFPDRNSVSCDDPAVSWALDELFSEAPWERKVLGQVKDVWSVLKRKVRETKTADAENQQAFDAFMKTQLWPQFKRVSGILLFDDCRFVYGRVNYHCHPAQRISHAAMGEIEKIMKTADRAAFQFTAR